MPFNYQSLKRITGAAVIDGSLVSGDLNNLAVTGGKLQTLSITGGKFATSSVDLSGSVTTGSLAVSLLPDPHPPTNMAQQKINIYLWLRRRYSFFISLTPIVN